MHKWKSNFFVTTEQSNISQKRFPDVIRESYRSHGTELELHCKQPIAIS